MNLLKRLAVVIFVLLCLSTASFSQITNTYCGGRQSNIGYYGGPVLNNPITVVPIFYGTHAAANVRGNIDFMNQLPSSGYWNLVQTYCDGSGNYVGALSIGSSATVSYPEGTSPSDSSLQSMLVSMMSASTIPTGANYIYTIILSTDVTFPVSGDVGYHSSFTHSGTNFVYAVVTPGNWPGAAYATMNNGDVYAQLTAWVMAHEWAETAADPYATLGSYGWGEIADGCEPGAGYYTGTPASFTSYFNIGGGGPYYYDMTLGTSDYTDPGDYLWEYRRMWTIWGVVTNETGARSGTCQVL